MRYAHLRLRSRTLLRSVPGVRRRRSLRSRRRRSGLSGIFFFSACWDTALGYYRPVVGWVSFGKVAAQPPVKEGIAAYRPLIRKPNSEMGGLSGGLKVSGGSGKESEGTLPISPLRGRSGLPGRGPSVAETSHQGRIRWSVFRDRQQVRGILERSVRPR